MSILYRLRKAGILLALILIMCIALALVLRKNVTLNIDRQSQSVTAYAITVGSLLHTLDISVSPLDELSPAQDKWLKNGDQITLVHAIPVQILADGQIRSLYSPDRIPSNLLTAVGVNVLPGDHVLSNGQVIDPSQPFPANTKSLSLQILPLVNYSITIDSSIKDLTSTASSLGSALWAAGYSFFAADQLIPPANTPLTPGLSATLNPSHQVIINVQDVYLTTRTAATTAGDALKDASLSVQGLDYSIPPLDAPIPSNGEMRLVRVSEDVLVEQSPLPFDTEYQPDPELEIDNQSILQTGEYGLFAQRLRVRYEDGQEVSRQVESEWVARQPKPRIIGYGTSVVMHTAVVDGVPIQYWRALNMYATSYHPSNTGNTTASGLPLEKGVAAVDTNLIPFYTQMYVPGYGEVIAADIGGGVVGHWIDLGYSDDDYVPWHQWVTVYFLWPPPDNIVWTVP
jgi:resuscitation-promoting factor RpfB